MSLALALSRARKRTSAWTVIAAYPFVIAILAALIHMVPVWHAQSQTAPGWTFTGNYSVSPDAMQYRVWFRQTQEMGFIVSNSHTTEPNQPYLIVILYAVVGQIARWSGSPPTFVYEYLGALFAFAFTLLLFLTTRHFSSSPRYVPWVFLATLVGGGLGAHLKIISAIGPVAASGIVQRLIVEPSISSPLFEDYRGMYAFTTLFDTHYLLIWIMLTLSVLSLFFTLQHFSWRRLVLTAAFYVAATTVHLYEGPTLVMITAAVTALCWGKGLAVRPALAALAAGSIAVAASLGFQAALHVSSGLPLPPWRAPNVLFSTLLIAFPLVWVLIGWGLGRYWKTAGLKEVFLLGWVLGCVSLILAGPFYPYPARGAMTLQIPLFIIAGEIFFSRLRTTPLAVLVAIALLGATPTWMVVKQWQATTFQDNAPYMFMDRAHQDIVGLLKQRATKDDVILAGKSDVDWRADDDLWLAPEYPGKWYVSHYFLTVDYDRKRAEDIRFFQRPPEEQASFLKEKGIHFLYVDATRDPGRFHSVPGLVLLTANSAGSLFEFTPTVVRASP